LDKALSLASRDPIVWVNYVEAMSILWRMDDAVRRLKKAIDGLIKAESICGAIQAELRVQHLMDEEAVLRELSESICNK
ncbi:MAG: hypothetical protein RXR16_08010, partial [Thermocladium sp.]